MNEFVCVAAWVSVGWVPSIGWWTSQWLLIWRTLTLLLSAAWYKAAYYWPSQLSRVHYYLSTVDWVTSSKVCRTRYPEGDTVGGDANREEYLFVVSVDFNRSYCSAAKLLSPNSLVQLQNEPQICKWNLMDSWIYFQRFTDAKKYMYTELFDKLNQLCKWGGNGYCIFGLKMAPEWLEIQCMVTFRKSTPKL